MAPRHEAGVLPLLRVFDGHKGSTRRVLPFSVSIKSGSEGRPYPVIYSASLRSLLITRYGWVNVLPVRFYLGVLPLWSEDYSLLANIAEERRRRRTRAGRALFSFRVVRFVNFGCRGYGSSSKGWRGPTFPFSGSSRLFGRFGRFLPYHFLSFGAVFLPSDMLAN